MKNIEGLTRFVESTSIDHRLIKKAETIELKESLSRCPKNVKLSESVNSTEGWWVPISFYNKVNGNNRDYNKRLWENVRDKQKERWLGSYMLDDHPEGDSDGKPGDACGIWLDMKLGEPEYNGAGLVYGLLIPATRKGEDLADILRKGGKIGTSSSGFGKLMSDGVTVDPDTYTIERLADWVLNPSQGTFFSYDESDDDITDISIRESLETEETMQENNITKENVVKDSKIAKLEEKKFRRDMESFLEDASNIKDPQERLEEFKEIKSFLEEGACPDLREKIEAKIADEEAEIKRMLAESIEMRDELGIKDSKDLKEKLTKISEDVKVLEKESKDWKAISEQLQTKYTEAKEALDSRPTVEYTAYLKDKNAKLSEQMKEQTAKAISVVKDLTESYKKMKEDYAALEEQYKASEEEKKALNESLEEAKKFNGFATEADSRNMNTYTKAMKELQEANEKIAKLSSIVASQRKLIETATEKNAALAAMNEKKSKQLKELMEEAKETQVALKRENSVKEAFKKSLKLSTVDEYYESLHETYGSQIEPFERKIKKATTLAEAKKVFYKDVFENLQESQDIEATRIPRTSYISAEDRMQILGEKNFRRTGIVDRKPQGWV